MSDLSNAPEFLPGDFVEFEPCDKPRHGMMMLAWLPGRRVCIFGKCVTHGGSFGLVLLNGEYPEFSSHEEPIELLSVAVRHHKDLRNRPWPVTFS